MEAVAQKFPIVRETVEIEIVRSSIIALQKALELYARDHENQFPQTLDALVNSPAKYLPALESDVWGRAYRYSVGAGSGDSNVFDLHSVGPDGLDGTPDDIYSKRP